MNSHFNQRSDNIKNAEAKGEGRRTRTNVEELESRLDKAMLACEAMWTFMREKFGLDDAQLSERINDIDLTDGKLDGKVRKPAVTCPKCGKNNARRFAKCMYCGTAIVSDELFS